MADAVSVIKQDHQMVGQLFEQYRQAGDGSTKASLVDQIVQGLKQHAEMEEQILYPRMREALGEDMLEQNMQEHDAMRKALGELETMTPDDAGFDQTVERLISDVMEHVRLEEQDELPDLQQRLGQEELDRLGEEMERFKGQGAA